MLTEQAKDMAIAWQMYRSQAFDSYRDALAEEHPKQKDNKDTYQLLTPEAATALFIARL